MNNWTQGDIDTGEINIHYYRTGHGDLPPLVLCHVFSDNGLCWTRVAEALASQFDIIMMDARNHGLSGHGSANLQDMSDDLATVIQALNLNQPAVLGHSMGASMVADLAARYPARVSRILLEDPPWTKHQGAVRDKDVAQRREGFRQYLTSLNNKTEAQIIAFGKQQNPTWHADELPAWAASKKQVSELAMEGLTLGNWSETVAQIQCPAWLIYADGERDGIVKHDIAQQVAAMNNHFTLRHIEDAGHNTRREQFDRYMSAVVEGLL
ncbi:MAG: alpha/beta hydrolase [SAR86 cluster bacterium]|uniref:Alpha/beta hydrolase n=1 Tax=SAR86 cluster bacterium TaxID=2030880 RepID=A0A973A8M1_9GAMM|nr:alpha/beta hydrolase [SAR86 cluster bacterium]